MRQGHWKFKTSLIGIISSRTACLRIKSEGEKEKSGDISSRALAEHVQGLRFNSDPKNKRRITRPCEVVVMKLEATRRTPQPERLTSI